MKISLVIPTYKRGDLLRESIRYALEQEFDSYELIVVDQTPENPPELESFLRQKAEAGELVWLKAQGWANLPGARNAGIHQAKGEVIVFIDDDVVLPPNFLSAYWQAFADKPEAWAVAGRILAPPIPETPCPVEEGFVKPNDPLATTEARFVPKARGCNMAFRASVFKEHGLYFDTRYVKNAHHEEADVFYRIAQAGGKTWFAPEAVMVHVREETGGCRELDEKESFPQGAHMEVRLTNAAFYELKNKGMPQALFAYGKEAAGFSWKYFKLYPSKLFTLGMISLKGFVRARRRNYQEADVDELSAQVVNALEK